MPTTVHDGIEPWDHQRVSDDTVALAQQIERVPLLEAPADARPGAYLLFTSTGDPLWGHFGDGSACGYCGSATSLQDRVGRHKRTFGALRDIRPEDVWVAQIPTSSRGAALYIEDLLTDALDPPLCVPSLAGLGSRYPGRIRSRYPGRIRSHGRQSRFDDLCPGRGWAREPHILDRATAVAELAARVANPSGVPRWLPLR